VDTRLPRPDSQIEARLRNAFQAVARTLFCRHVPPPSFVAAVPLVPHQIVAPTLPQHPAPDGNRTN